MRRVTTPEGAPYASHNHPRPAGRRAGLPGNGGSGLRGNQLPAPASGLGLHQPASRNPPAALRGTGWPRPDVHRAGEDAADARLRSEWRELPRHRDQRAGRRLSSAALPEGPSDLRVHRSGADLRHRLLGLPPLQQRPHVNTPTRSSRSKKRSTTMRTLITTIAIGLAVVVPAAAAE